MNRVAIAIGAVLGGTALGLLRRPGTVALDTVWAEDGSIFLAGATRLSVIDALTSSYAGYYHLVPRMLGELAVLFPAGAADAVLAISAAGVTAALAVLVYIASAGHLHTRLARVLVSAPVVLAPLAQEDVPASIANMHWPALYALFWLFAWTPAGRVGRIVAPVTILLVALSDILVLAYAPLALLRLGVRRDRYSGLLAAALGVGLVVQFASLLAGSSERGITLNPVRWATGYVLRAVPAAVFGERFLPDGPVQTQRLVLAAAAWLVLAAVLAFAVWTTPRHRPSLDDPQWRLAAVAVAQSVALYALPVVLTGVATPRYALAPALLLIVAVAALLQKQAASHESRTPLRVLAVALFVVLALNFRVDTARDDGPLWNNELDRARVACGATGAPSTVDVLISPAVDGWKATLPCDYVS